MITRTPSGLSGIRHEGAVGFQQIIVYFVIELEEDTEVARKRDQYLLVQPSMIMVIILQPEPVAPRPGDIPD